LDQGYNPADSINHAYSVAVELETSKDLARRKAERSMVCQSYTEGVFDEDRAIAVLTQTGLAGDEAQSFIDRCKATAKLKILKAAKAAIRQGYMRGQYDANAIRNMLNQIGVADRRIGELVQLWTLQRDAQSKELKASEMCSFIADGTLTYAQMQTRLLNLNYRPDDVQRIVRHCQLGHLAKDTKERIKLIKAQAKEREQTQRLLEQKQRQADTDKRRVLRDWLTLHSEKNIKEWLGRCIISEDDVRDVYRSRGVDPQAVERMLSVWRGDESSCEGDSDENATGDRSDTAGGTAGESD